MMPVVPPQPVVLVDGSSYLYRAFHALPPLTNDAGEPTGAVYGVLNMIKKLIKTYEPTHLCVVFDPKGPTFRNDLYAEYKANRPPMPVELQQQVEPLHAMIKAMGIPLVLVEGVEADDVIGTLAKQITANQRPVLISTGDKDMAQLVNDNVTLINTMTDTVLDRSGVIEKFGLPPESIVDYLALIGDKVDNVPGVPKVGPKTAIKWLTQYQTLENICAHADEFTGKIGTYLQESLVQLPLSKRLVTIKDDVALDYDLESLALGEEHTSVLIDWLKKMGFKTWLKQVMTGAADTNAEKHYTIITEQAVFDAWLTRLNAAEFFSFDTETTSLQAVSAEIVGVSFAVKSGEAAYVPLAHEDPDTPNQLDRTQVLAALKPLLECQQPRVVGQNLKYDKRVLMNYGIELNAIAFDTILASYVYNSSASRHDMDSLALKYLDRTTIKYEAVAGKGAKQIAFNRVPVEVAGPYAAEDADITWQLFEYFKPKLEAEPALKAVFYEMELPLLSVLARIENTGVLIDSDLLKTQSRELQTHITALENKAYELAGQPFNLGSPKQLQEILYEKMQLPVLKKTPKGQPSTAEEVLSTLALDYPLPKLILQYRSFSKLKSTYTDRLPEDVQAKTGRIHTSYHQAVAGTGRLSSSDPNLQNIPVRTEQGRNIRKAFIAPPGYQIMSADYSQIELRIMAHISQDSGLLEAFANDLDVHRATASEVFSCDYESVSADQRRHAKAINFGLMYGMSAFGLAKQLGLEREAAQAYIDLYFQRYPKVQDYMDRTRTLAAEQGYVETIFGRRLYLPDIKASNFQRRQAAERAAINAPLQGTSADIIKRAMLCVETALASEALQARLIMQVHDELVLEVSKTQLAEAEALLRRCMAEAAQLDVPLLVDVGVGENWEAAH